MKYVPELQEVKVNSWNSHKNRSKTTILSLGPRSSRWVLKEEGK